MASSPQHRVFEKGSCISLLKGCGSDNKSSQGNDVPVQNGNLQREEMKETQDLLASGLSKLTVQERTEALYDVHCVGEELKEDPEIIQKALSDFDKAIQQEHNPTYEIASNQNKAYVQDPTFRLRFLRANSFNVGQSLGQMMKFLQYKAAYFGAETIAREITLDDLTTEDMKLMLSGLYHIQDGKDRMGRLVIYMFSNMLCSSTVESLVRVSFYVWFNIILSDHDVQRKGVTAIYYDVNSRPGEKVKKPGINFMMKVLGPLNSLPGRYTALHYCLLKTKSSLALNSTVLRLSVNNIPGYVRVRSRLHLGSDMELQYLLKSHGIPIDTFPVDVNGNIRENILNKWFNKHQEAIDKDTPSANAQVPELNASACTFTKQEGNVENGKAVPSNRASSASARTVQPLDTDILSGRGRKSQDHPGNVRFRDMLEEHSVEYDKAPRHERRRITTEFTRLLASQGIRFLDQIESGDWVECDFAEGRTKVSQQFRTLRKKKSRA
ncbi:unnamed protein product [Cylindrotheca closterium]|uniref:DUF6824 domain-containing protein n=1 Tax=Cylindrotheca closterium TaxID=2856 RepID=A0AAD2G801_9STRA|nr:unnamed protein product [Cylindrotheca closterium]